MPLIEKIFNPLSAFHHRRIFMYLKNLDIDKIIDIGAHEGRFLEKMLKIEKINSFYAFEPQKDIFDSLSKKFSKNDKITLLNYALGKEIANKKLQINKLSMTSSLAEVNEESLYFKLKNFLTGSKSNFIDEYEVQTNTIDNVFKDVSLKKTLLKIDVEGFEMNVIQGSLMKLNEIPYIIIENQFGNHYKNNNFNDTRCFLKYNFFTKNLFFQPCIIGYII